MSKQKATQNRRKDLDKTQISFPDHNQGYFDVDPDLQTDVAIEFPKASARTRESASGKSRQTNNTRRSNRPPEHNENVVLSRSRPIKPHETEPFLSINNLPPDKTFISDKSTVTTTANSRASVMKGSTVHPTPRTTSQPQPKSGYVTPGSHAVTPPPPSPHTGTDSVATETTKRTRSRTSLGYGKTGNQPTTTELDPNSKDNLENKPKDDIESSRSPVGKLTNGDTGYGSVTPDTSNIVTKPNSSASKQSRPSTANACIEGHKNHEKQVRIDLRPSRPSTASGVSRSQDSRPSTGSQQGRPRSYRLTSAQQRSRPGSQRSQRSRFSSPRSMRPSTAGSRPGSRTVGLGCRSATTRSGRLTPANTPYQSPNKPLRPPNCHLKSPFKHAVSNNEPVPDGRQTPSMGLKERTALAAYHVHKMLTVAGEKDPHKVEGRLKKGKLKPLYPVNVQGPNITQCRGIVSEAHSYQPSPSRTLQRRLQLVNSIPNVHEYLYNRPHTNESVHQTSVASSIDENYDQDALDTDRNLPDEILYNEESVMEPVTPENTFIPGLSQQPTYIRDENFAPVSEESATVFATEVDNPREVSSDLTISNQLQHELHVSESQEGSTQVSMTTNGNNNNTQNGGPGENADETVDTASKMARLGSPSKSVRFAEGNAGQASEPTSVSKEEKQRTNESIAKQQVESKQMEKDKDDVDGNHKKSSKSSCKDDDVDGIHRKKDEDDDGNGDDSRNRREIIRNGMSQQNNNASSDNTGNTSANGTNNDNENGSKANEQKDSVELDTEANKNKQTVQEETQQPATKTKQKHIHSDSPTCTKPSKPSSARKTSQEKQTESYSTKKDKARKALQKQTRQSSARLSARPASANGRCEKFDKSPASKPRTNRLEVSSVLHGSSVVNVVNQESPRRYKPRSPSPMRFEKSGFRSPIGNNYVFGANSRPCFENVDEFDPMYEKGQRSKVKFMLNDEEPEMETIFIDNDDGEVDLKQDTAINFDVLDAELGMLRSDIHNSLLDNSQAANNAEQQNYKDSDEESECDVVDVDSGDDLDDPSGIAMEMETIDTIRGDYSKLLDKYRQRCMDRSEACGAISTQLVTPRDAQGLVLTRPRSGCRSSDGNSGNGKVNKVTRKTRPVSITTLSDSGRGSVENLSEISKQENMSDNTRPSSGNLTLTPPAVPRLDLGGSTSDLGLGLDSARSDVTITKETVTNGNHVKVENQEEEYSGEKNLLELVCEQLSPFVKKPKTPSRKEVSADVSELKVVATTKSLSKNKLGKLPLDSSQRAPFPPLCFTINARPPAGYLYYFAYGPDMNPNRFSSYIQREVDQRYWGLLFGFNLVFNKRGTSEEAGGFANLEFNPLRSVEGCVYKITQAELQVLDKCVGYPEHYEHLMLPVWLSNTSDPDGVGVSQYCVPALTYIAQQNWTETEKTLPCDYALSQCIKSADLLTPQYRDTLVSMAAQQPVVC